MTEHPMNEVRRMPKPSQRGLARKRLIELLNSTPPLDPERRQAQENEIELLQEFLLKQDRKP